MVTVEPMYETYEQERLIRVFVDTVEDLRVRTRLNASEYDVAQGAGLLRRLLTDGTPLGPTLAKAAGFTPTFEWYAAYQGADEDASLRYAIDPVVVDAMLSVGQMKGSASDHGNHLANAVRRGSHHDLLATPFFGTGTPEITLKWLVRHLAHDEGGVHVGMSKDTPERLRRVYEADRRLLMWTMTALGRVVVRAYEPLVFHLVRIDPHYGIAPVPMASA